MRAILIGLLISVSAYAEQTSLTDDHHPSGWFKEIRQTAVDSYLYAQIASNTYEEGFYFALPENVVLKELHQNDGIGFAYSVYEVATDGALPEVILSFRGTENFKDWWYGNIRNSQNMAGERVYAEIKNKYHNSKVVLTGHSLGGAIAQNIAVKNKGVEAFVFNTSPHHSTRGDGDGNRIESIVEHGEVLKIFRLPAPESKQTYTSIGCSSGGPISQHAQNRLALCLTQIAATETDAARLSLSINHLPVRFSWLDKPNPSLQARRP